MNKNCFINDFKNKKLDYAKAYIPPQPYENLFSIDDVLKTGTIFMDLYDSYDYHKKSKHYEVK